MDSLWFLYYDNLVVVFHLVGSEVFNDADDLLIIACSRQPLRQIYPSWLGVQTQNTCQTVGIYRQKTCSCTISTFLYYDDLVVVSHLVGSEVFYDAGMQLISSSILLDLKVSMMQLTSSSSFKNTFFQPVFSAIGYSCWYSSVPAWNYKCTTTGINVN